jgi:aspartyl-tRNA(Asn)/glutamyl-tRNA(Gln) amidotransferase subunit A
VAGTSEAHYWTAAECTDAYARNIASPVEVTRAVLDRIDAVDSQLNAFCVRDDKAALAMARASEARWRRRAPWSGLDGVCVSIKDLILTRGWPTRYGSRAFTAEGPWDEDAPCVARLREAGAVLIGKTTTPELGNSGVTESPLTGLTVNPWDPGRTPGGSSGGSAAAVAAGCGALSVGSDGGGSIRTPASFCNLVGLKPTFGRVAQSHGEDLGELSCTGPIARTVGDAARLMNVIARPDARDWLALPDDGCDYAARLEEGVAGLRIAASVDLGFAPVAPPIRAAFEAALERFRELGADVALDHPAIADPTGWFDVLWHCLAADAVARLTPEQRERLGPEMRRSAEAGRAKSAAELLDALHCRSELARAMAAFDERYDLLLTPTTSVLPFPTGLASPPDWPLATDNFEVLVGPFNATRQPAATVPCAFSAEGLPIGLQIVGRRYADAVVLRAARAFERINPLYDRHPTL